MDDASAAAPPPVVLTDAGTSCLETTLAIEKAALRTQGVSPPAARALLKGAPTSSATGRSPFAPAGGCASLFEGVRQRTTRRPARTFFDRRLRAGDTCPPPLRLTRRTARCRSAPRCQS